jgi:ketosteroid isomerase-like protein
MAAKSNEFQINKLIENWAKAVRAKDIDKVIAHHSPDILLFDVPEPLQSKGIDAYRLSWEGLFFPCNGDNSRFDISELSITAGDDVAFCHGIVNCNGSENGQKIDLEIRLTVGLKKIDNQWTIMHEHHSEAAS